jgi:hypothetical protein
MVATTVSTKLLQFLHGCYKCSAFITNPTQLLQAANNSLLENGPQTKKLNSLVFYGRNRGLPFRLRHPIRWDKAVFPCPFSWIPLKAPHSWTSSIEKLPHNSLPESAPQNKKLNFLVVCRAFYNHAPGSPYRLNSWTAIGEKLPHNSLLENGLQTKKANFIFFVVVEACPSD